MKIKYIKYMNLWNFIFIAVMVAAIGIIAVKGLNWGIDFTGGTLVEVKYSKVMDGKQMEPVLNNIAVTHPSFVKEKRSVTYSPSEDGKGTIVLMRVPEVQDAERAEIISMLKSATGEFELRKVEKVGATIGKELRNTAIASLIVGTILIMAYITLRFEMKYAVSAIVALLHDIVVAIGVISLLGFEVNSTFVAAILTILGYSINDTIVVYDRIRENRKKMPGEDLGQVMDLSINQVFTRSLNTSLTTLIALVAIAVFGGESLRTFTITLIAGIASGTYSSIFVASPLVYLIEKMMPKKEKTEEALKSI